MEKNTVLDGVLRYSRNCVWEREQPVSDHARQVRFMVKKVLFCEQERCL